MQVNVLSVSMPYYGIWEGDCELVTPQVITNPLNIQIGNLSLRGAIYRYDSFAGVTYIRFVGGNAGWRKTLPAQCYSSPNSGIKMSTILQDAASAVGESIVVKSNPIVGNYFVRSNSPAQYLLGLLAGPEWYMSTTGLTYLADRNLFIVNTPFTVISADSGKGWYDIATEDYVSWIPGAMFSSPTVPNQKTVSFVRIDVDNAGISRLKVLTTP